MTKIRAFIAISLPVEVRHFLEKTGKDLGASISSRKIRWVNAKNIHLTLKFLGDTETEKFEQIARVIDRAAANQKYFELRLGELGCFPHPKRPRVIWVGLKGDIGNLIRMQRTIEEGLVPLGWDMENRGFHPHLTLGRVKDSRAILRANFPWGKALESLTIPIRAIHLIESELLPQGAVYTTRYSSSLTNQTNVDDGPR